MKRFVFQCMMLIISATAFAQGYKIGDQATDFALKNIDGKIVKLSDDSSAKGFVIIFTCNHCPYAVAYEDRIIAIDRKYRSLGYPVIAINPNDPVAYPSDSFEAMQQRAAEKGFTFPYLVDQTQQIARTYGAAKNTTCISSAERNEQNNCQIHRHHRRQLPRCQRSEGALSCQCHRSTIVRKNNRIYRNQSSWMQHQMEEIASPK